MFASAFDSTTATAAVASDGSATLVRLKSEVIFGTIGKIGEDYREKCGDKAEKSTNLKLNYVV